jgi:EAL domain-containing protein (putative c-di-GMP-specific phosphodiesterase class I)
VLSSQPPDALVRRVLADGGLRTVFQPVVDLHSSQVIGHEALTRGPAGTAVESPDALFEAARACGRLAELDWACRCQAFRVAGQARLQAPARLFVNAEPQVLGTACPPHLLRDWVYAHRRLRVVVEVTERYLCDAPGDLLRVTATLHELGWEVALDDVGANDAGVALLPVLRPDIVKLDMALLAPHPGRAARKVLRAVGAYAERTGAAVVAEGIETEEHLSRAIALGATWGQGWLFGRPVPLEPAPVGTPTAKPPRARGREGADPRVRTDPYALLSPGQDRGSECDRALVQPQVVRELDEACRAGLDLSSGSLVLVSVGRPELAPPGLRALLRQLRRICALVVLLTGDPEDAADPSVRTTSLADGDPLRRDAAVALLSPERALAFHARQSDDGRWTARRTTDGEQVGEVVRALLTRAAPVLPQAFSSR